MNKHSTNTNFNNAHRISYLVQGVPLQPSRKALINAIAMQGTEHNHRGYYIMFAMIIFVSRERKAPEWPISRYIDFSIDTNHPSTANEWLNIKYNIFNIKLINTWTNTFIHNNIPRRIGWICCFGWTVVVFVVVTSNGNSNASKLQHLCRCI